jgi:hypothetical protein
VKLFNKYANHFFTLITLVLLGFQVYFSSWLNIKGDVFYNEDIARDLLLIEDIIRNHHLGLIGPRISVAGGLFHGPLWIYLNIPAYIIGHGNPFIMGIFWQLLYCCLLASTYFVAKKLYDNIVGLLSVLLLSSATYTYIFSNTYGALLTFPWYFYFLSKYLKTLKIKYLLTSFLLGGLMVQFEIAFAGPILLATLVYLACFLGTKKKLLHLLSFFIILLPLSTYILFDLRHKFLQAHAAITFLTTHHKSTQQHTSLLSYILNHFALISNSSLQAFTHGYVILTFIVITIFIYVILISKNHAADYFRNYVLFLVLYGGFWILSLIYKDGMWVWYYNEFTPVIAIIFCSAYRLLNRYVFVIIFLLLYGTGIWSQVIYATNIQNSFVEKNSYSWQLYYNIAKKVYANGPSQFGYYINEHDDLGYRTRYAMHYAQRFSSNIAYEDKKKTTTYLIEEGDLNNAWWQKAKIHITNRPILTTSIGNYQIQKFSLTLKETAIPSDSTIIDNLFFR